MAEDRNTSTEEGQMVSPGRGYHYPTQGPTTGTTPEV